ncbi:hypothetical protein MATL_G00243040 [Megalops atlanticus]|uniref:Uncharacterized protein n=1 Tax=Megalops atlanticus TaxID=7932 RepID=A0A9D3PCL8_MEGAT|nr:hypothetical protein MATL_G00243040 [Megalops atlanticus]
MNSLKSQHLKISRLVNMLLHMTGFLCGGSEGLAAAAAGSITNMTVGENVLWYIGSNPVHLVLHLIAHWNTKMSKWNKVKAGNVGKRKKLRDHAKTNIRILKLTRILYSYGCC